MATLKYLQLIDDVAAKKSNLKDPGVIKSIQLIQHDPGAAERAFSHAIGIAQQQSAKLWELRAATSLARLWRDQGKRAEAHALLQPAYAWFTEGFDTLDLIEAKALLEEPGA